jgi:D-alanyl-D-alanine carboxypeptidase (penicillin-binding protein 5/6)
MRARATGIPGLVAGLAGALALLCGAAPGAAAADAPRAPALPAKAAALYVPATKQFLYADDANGRRSIASTTKMMTALVTLQHVHDLNTVFSYPDYRQAADDSQIGLTPGDRMTVRDLIIAMMLPSADDAAEDLADNVGHGSVTRFVAWMNADARRLGLTHTHFSTPIGLDTPGNYSTAADLDRLAAYDLSHHPFFARVVNMPEAQLTSGPVSEVSNLNLLLGEYPWVDGVKTGHTSGAGWVLVAAGHQHGLRLVASVLGTPTDQDSDSSALALLEYGYDNYRMRTPVHAHEALAHPTVKDRPGVRVPVRAARGYRRVLARSGDIHVRVDVPRQLAGPLPAGTVVGTAVVLDGPQALTRVPVVLERRLAAVPRLTLVGRFFTSRPWLIAMLALAMLAALAVVGLVRRAGGRGSGSGRARRRRTTRRAGSGWNSA